MNISARAKSGCTAFRFIMRDRRFRKIPKVLETPKGKDLREDVINLKTLRRLMKTTPRSTQHANQLINRIVKG